MTIWTEALRSSAMFDWSAQQLQADLDAYDAAVDDHVEKTVCAKQQEWIAALRPVFEAAWAEDALKAAQRPLMPDDLWPPEGEWPRFEIVLTARQRARLRQIAAEARAKGLLHIPTSGMIEP